jgi:hypothetical protein
MHKLTTQISEAVLGGCQSTFDSSEWLDLPPDEKPDEEYEDFTCISKEIARQMIQLPRLIELVRQIRGNPSEVDTGIEALALAERLYCRYPDIVAPRIDATLITRTAWVATLDEDLARYYPESLGF